MRKGGGASRFPSSRPVRRCPERPQTATPTRKPPFQHGNGLALGASLCTTPYFITLDSDTIVNRGVWIEKMLERFDTNLALFAIGNVVTASKDCVRKGKRDHRFVHPFCAMWDREKYDELGRFMMTGQPACTICQEAIQAGYDLETLDGLAVRGKQTGYITHALGGTRLKIRRGIRRYMRSQMV